MSTYTIHDKITIQLIHTILKNERTVQYVFHTLEEKYTVEVESDLIVKENLPLNSICMNLNSHNNELSLQELLTDFFMLHFEAELDELPYTLTIEKSQLCYVLHTYIYDFVKVGTRENMLQSVMMFDSLDTLTKHFSEMYNYSLHDVDCELKNLNGRDTPFFFVKIPSQQRQIFFHIYPTLRY